MKREIVVLQTALKELPAWYADYCRGKGLKESSIHLYMKICPKFLKGLEDAGATSAAEINMARVSKACLVLKSNWYLSTIHTFLHDMAEGGLTDRDYSYGLPYFKRPQPMPSVYSVEEMRRAEAAVDKTRPSGKRDYATLLLCTRLGIRGGDIAALTFDRLDFDAEIIRLTQQKTEIPLDLPMMPEIKSSLLDYIGNERADSESPYVFLSLSPPYSHISVQRIGKLVTRALRDAGIDPAGRKTGPHAFRSSLASSMINDNVPYEVVRKTLGHSDLNAIKSYARLDTEQMRIYALEVPAATGAFVAFLSGRSAR